MSVPLVRARPIRAVLAAHACKDEAQRRPRFSGPKAQRPKGTAAQRHSGPKAQRPKSKAQRPIYQSHGKDNWACLDDMGDQCPQSRRSGPKGLAAHKAQGPVIAIGIHPGLSIDSLQYLRKWHGEKTSSLLTNQEESKGGTHVNTAHGVASQTHGVASHPL